MIQAISAFFMSVWMLLSALPGAALHPKQNLLALEARWRILAGGISMHQNTEYDIIIVAGQSNAFGCGLGPVDDPFQPDDRIQQMPQGANLLGGYSIARAEEPIADGQPWANLGLPFAREYIRAGLLQPGRKLLILQAAVGGTGFADKHWGLHDDLYQNMLRMIETALALNPGNALKALLWHQGETDASFQASQETHTANLQGLVRDVRARFGVPALPFIAGDFVEQWRLANAEICAPVIAAMRAVCGSEGNAAFVETDGLLSNEEAIQNGDTIHFSRSALYALGMRYFEAYQGIVTA